VGVLIRLHLHLLLLLHLLLVGWKAELLIGMALRNIILLILLLLCEFLIGRHLLRSLLDLVSAGILGHLLLFVQLLLAHVLSRLFRYLRWVFHFTLDVFGFNINLFF